MKKISPIILMIAAIACNNNTNYKKAEDAQDAGREFIRASLDGNHDKARFFLYADSTNQFMFNRWKQDEKSKYKDADIVVLAITPENDSVVTYKYYNSYKKDTTTIKVLRINGEWLVDLKELIKTHK